MGCGSSRQTDAGDSNRRTIPDVINPPPSEDVTISTRHYKLDHVITEAQFPAPAAVGQLQTSEPEEMTLTKTEERSLTILHFNDVYNIEPREEEPVGGAARFASKLRSYEHLNPLIVFSGDCLNPSTMSSVTRGKQMIPVLNALNVHIGVYGNHEFDFGVDDLLSFNEETNFPWLMSNVVDKETNRPLGDGKVKHIIKWSGKRIGFIGLVEEDWLATLATIDSDELEFFDFVTMGTKLAKELRDEGAEFVIALTHMRIPNDCRLAKEASGIDMILGGHDHHYEVQQLNGVHLIKSGTDFRELSEIALNFTNESNYTVDIKRVEITSDVEEDAEVKQIVNQFLDVMQDKLEEELGHVEVELDGRFSSVRTRETNLGNFIADIMCNVTEADIALLNAGTIRSDVLHPPGEFKMKDLMAILPMAESLVLLEVTVEQILGALENGVSQWPRHEGRFPQVSGMRFTFDPKKERGSRIVRGSVQIRGHALQGSKTYTMCTKAYLANGKDGYKGLTQAKMLINQEEGPVLPTVVQNHFRSVSIVKGNTKTRSSHRQSLVMRSGDHTSLIQELGMQAKLELGTRRRRHSMPSKLLLQIERAHVRIDPQTEGRITIVDEPPAPRARGLSVCEPVEELVVMRQEFQRENCPQDELTEEHRKAYIEDSSAGRNDGEQWQRYDVNGNVVTDSDAAANAEKATTEHGRGLSQTRGVTPPVEPEKPDLATEDDYWDLWEAAKADNIDVVKGLRQEKNIRFTRIQDNKTILHLGSERNAAKVVEFLINEGKMDPNVLDEILKGVPLHGAAEYGAVDAARVLLQHGAEVNKQDLIGNSALHIACENQQIDVKNLLIDNGADSTLINSDGETPAI